MIDDGGIAFVVRRATLDAGCPLPFATRPRSDAGGALSASDPFMQPEPELFVADVSATHYALLNKFNVLDRHLLLVTRAYVDQEEPLDAADFEALVACMGDEHVLGFYNGGKAAGASQPHKHLQVVRLPLAPHGRDLPIEALIERQSRDADALHGLAFRNAFVRLEDPHDPQMLLAHYERLLERAGARASPYNLLVARDWMLLVPRARAAFEGIEVNSLGFGGALFVRNEAQMATVERVGPMAILRGVAPPRERP